MAARALVPEGFMPAPGHLVQMCTQAGARMVRVDLETGETAPAGDHDAGTHCPWSVVLTALAFPVAPVQVADGTAADPPPEARPAFLASRPRFARPPARAPPSTG